MNWTQADTRRSRKYTCKLLDLAEEGVIDWESLARDALGWMSEDEVAEFARRNDYLEFDEEPVAEGLVDYIGRKFRVKTTKGKPDLKNAPRWATALGQTPQGAWHWLEKNGPIETPDSDRYFPLSGKTEFTGFVSKYEGKQGVEEE